MTLHSLALNLLKIRILFILITAIEETFVKKVLVSLECFNEKEVNFYVFENKEENYITNGVTKTYTRTAPVDKKWKVCDIRYCQENKSKIIYVIDPML